MLVIYQTDCTKNNNKNMPSIAATGLKQTHMQSADINN